MANEIETKVLDIDADDIVRRLEALGAKKILDTRLTVDWFRPRDLEDGADQWYLRIRSDSRGKVEITWKGKSTELGLAHSRPEINLGITDAAAGAELLEAIGLSQYAHQEKDRKSFTLSDWRFDLDQYPSALPLGAVAGEIDSNLSETDKGRLRPNRSYGAEGLHSLQPNLRPISPGMVLRGKVSMPPYLEIEGPSEKSIKEAMSKLGVSDNRTWNQGERTLIEQLYALNWHDMRFS